MVVLYGIEKLEVESDCLMLLKQRTQNKWPVNAYFLDRLCIQYIKSSSLLNYVFGSFGLMNFWMSRIVGKYSFLSNLLNLFSWCVWSLTRIYKTLSYLFWNKSMLCVTDIQTGSTPMLGFCMTEVKLNCKNVIVYDIINLNQPTTYSHICGR